MNHLTKNIKHKFLTTLNISMSYLVRFYRFCLFSEFSLKGLISGLAQFTKSRMSNFSEESEPPVTEIFPATTDFFVVLSTSNTISTLYSSPSGRRFTQSSSVIDSTERPNPDKKINITFFILITSECEIYHLNYYRMFEKSMNL